ncbi:MAG TPA: hypothetical protein VFS30_00660 [Dehalococcoidia bacterium]|nr:hypothetical protein [Dehalococcoidia bacterium]
MATTTLNGASESVDAPIVQISRIAAETIEVPIIGTSPLIINRFGEKAKRQLLDGQQGRKSPKTTRDPQADFEAAMHRLADGGYGFPITGFKAATISAARFYGKDVTMTALRQFLFFHGEPGIGGEQMARIVGGEPVMREDVVRLSGRSTDLRYRPMFTEWSTVLKVTYVTSAVSRDSVLSLIDAGGLGVGVGEWRPEKSGVYGTYQIDTAKNVEVV